MNSAVIARTVEARMADRLIVEVGADRYARYFQGSVRFEVSEGVLGVVVPSEFHKRWLERQFSEAVQVVARAELGDASARVEWGVDPGVAEHASVNEAAVESAAKSLRADAEGSAPTPPGALPPGSFPAPGMTPGMTPAPGMTPGTIAGGVSVAEGVRARARQQDEAASARERRSAPVRHRLEDFVVGDCNRLAYSAALRMAEGGASSYGVLFVHGVCGVGKTHLLQGLARHVRRQNAAARVRYTTGERFANEYIASVQNRTIDAFRKRYRGVDLLCVDDVHFIAGKRGTQSEFLHTFATLDLDGARVVLASDEHPKQIGDLQEAIVSRCVSGMVVGMEKPDRATRREICMRLAGRRGLILDESAVEALASLDACSVRDLEGAVMHVEACVHLLPDVVRVQDGVVDGALVRRVLGSRRAVKPNRPYRVDEILQASCEVIGVEVSEVLGPSRHRRVVIARSICAKLSKQLTTHSYPEIAKLMHRPNHSTIITAHKRIEEQIAAGERVGGGGGVGEWTVLEACERVSERLRAAR